MVEHPPLHVPDVLAGDPVEVAPLLLGAVVRSRDVAVRLTEVEAYRGVGEDPGSHAHRGITPRTTPMFGPPGTVYVYLSYGMHRCLNIVCGPEGSAGAVLLRAGQVLEGVELARQRRAAAAPRRTGACATGIIIERDLARGPARLATCLGIELADTGGMLSAGPVSLELPDLASTELIEQGPRVGVSGPGGSAEHPWRYWLAGDPTVSVYRPSPR